MVRCGPAWEDVPLQIRKYAEVSKNQGLFILSTGGLYGTEYIYYHYTAVR
jgi:hypothetical protein